jgi:hypothetical protein
VSSSTNIGLFSNAEDEHPAKMDMANVAFLLTQDMEHSEEAGFQKMLSDTEIRTNAYITMEKLKEIVLSILDRRSKNKNMIRNTK